MFRFSLFGYSFLLLISTHGLAMSSSSTTTTTEDGETTTTTTEIDTPWIGPGIYFGIYCSNEEDYYIAHRRYHYERERYRQGNREEERHENHEERHEDRQGNRSGRGGGGRK